MKNLLLLIVLVIFTQTFFAQTKIDEYERTDSDAESGRIDNFLMNLDKQPESRGLIIIYSGESEERLGNILRLIEGIKQYIVFRDVYSRAARTFTERITFKIEKGKETLFKELWVYPKDIPLPEIEQPNVNLDNLKTKYLYASVCVDCEPAIPGLSSEWADFKLYAELLMKYRDYKSSIIIYSPSRNRLSKKESYRDALAYAAKYRNLLAKEYKIDNRRISIRIETPIVKDLTPISAKFFITPKIIK